ncbi:MAG: response regulator [Candidatus Hydrogenedentota bacterium]
MDDKRLRRNMTVVFIASGAGVLLIILTFILWRGGVIGQKYARLLFLVATVLVAAVPLRVAAVVSYIPKVTPALYTGAALAIVSQIMHAADNFAFTWKLPLIGRDSVLYLHYLDDMLLYTGLAVLICSAYLAVLETARMRVQLTVESEEKSLAIQAGQRYAEALAKSERKAREQLAELNNLYNTAPVGLCYLDGALRCVRVNQFFAQLDGSAASAHVNKPVAEMVPHLGETLARMSRDTLQRGQAHQNVELKVGHPAQEGQTREQVWLVSCFPVFRQAKAVAGVQLVVQDITGMRAAQEAQRHLEVQVQQAQRLRSLGVLAGGIAHDFNNLLTGILGNASLALHQPELSEKTCRVLQTVEQAAQRATELTNQMLAYAGQGDIELRPLNVTQVLRESEPVLRASAGTNVELTCHYNEVQETVMGDGAQLHQVLLNLVLNAAESLPPEGGLINVTAGETHCDELYVRRCAGYEEAAPGTYSFIEVADTGCGMDAETREAVFDPFFSTKFTGRGLGLAVTLGVVRHHRGLVFVDSTVGEGSRFRILLPGLSVPGAGSGKRGSGNERDVVLIIDDDEAVRFAGAEIVQDIGLSSLCAASGEEGVALFEEHQGAIIAVLLDLTMPGMNGRETFDALRQHDAHVPIVLVSGYTDDAAVAEMFAGVEPVRFLRKPFTYEALASLLT